MITGNYKFLNLLSVLLIHTSGVLSEHAFAQVIKEPSSFVSNLGNLEDLNFGGFVASPVPNKITETPLQAVSVEPPPSPSPPTQNAPAKKESVMTDEELEFLLFGSIDEVGLPETESEENNFIELAESRRIERLDGLPIG